MGTKVEVKNMNSFRSLERAVDHEISRQIAVLEGGGHLVQETRHWDEEASVTHSMRVKEGSSDYRYFAEPDLPPLVIDREWVDRVTASLPELPAERRRRYLEAGLDAHAASVLSKADADVRQLYDDALVAGADPSAAARWLTGEVTAALRRLGLSADESTLDGGVVAELLDMVGSGEVSASAAKEVLAGVLGGGGSPRSVAQEHDLIQVSDVAAVERLVDAVLADNPGAADRYRAGESKVLGFLVGQVMRTSGGKADPRLTNELLRSLLEG